VADRSRHSLPDLGRRGEGWFVVQIVLLATVALAGGLGPDWSGPARTAGIVLGAILVGQGGLLAARGVLDLRENLSVFPRPPAGARLVDTGAYRLVRHPIYGGLILGALSWSLVTASTPAMAGTAVLALFLDLKSRREELWLGRQFDGYGAYRARTRRFVPWLY
jgi:protein-S-isoprenylcysteine O-methyltransferase Ste14